MQENGITLVALVITIIIIIILATVAISMVLGEGGILNISQNARELTGIENVREKLEVAKGMAAIDGNGHIDPDHYFDIIEEEGIIWDKEKDVVPKGDGIYNVTTKEGYVFEIILGEDGDITIDYVGKENVTGPRIREIRVIETSSNSVRIEVVADNVERATYTYSAKQEPLGEWEEKGTSSDNIYTIEGLTSEKAYTIRVVVETSEGSTEEEIGVTIGELPTGIITFGDTTWSDGQASVTINTESSYTLQYQINGIDEDNWTEITNGEAVTGLEWGETLYARLWDGTNGGEHASVDIEDKTAPTVTVNRGTVTSNSIAVSVTANDAESGMADTPTYTYYIKLTNEQNTSYTAKATDVTSSSYTFSGLTQGVSYDIRVEVKADKANNTGAGTLLNVTTGTVTSGLEEGAITFGNTTWSNGQASVTVSTNTNYTIQYQKNGIAEGSWTEISSGSAVTGLEWEDTLYARLWDGTNGGEYASVDIEDKIPPTVSIDATSATDDSITVNVIARDSESGLATSGTYQYYIDNAIQTTSEDNNYTFEGLNVGTSYIIKVVVTDKAGNDNEAETTVTTTDSNRERFSDIYETTSQYTDSQGNTAWIPQGFAVGVSDGINTINGGLVVTDKIDENHYSIGNEFVWIPVDSTSLGEMYRTTSGTALSRSSLGESTTTTTVYSNLRVRSGDSGDFTAGTPNSLNIREPDITTDADASTTGISAIKSAFALDGTNANVLKAFAQMLVDEYTATYNSVRDHGGFYIGRYEITGTVEEPTVQRNQTVLARQNWYELKKACNNIVSTDYAQTEMVYGNQWDEIMDWLVDTNEKTSNEVYVDSTAWGNYDDYNDVNGFVEGDQNYIDGAGRVKTSGFCEMWKANNIYDIAGNCWEWTQEADGSDYRIGRGRYDIYGSDAPASTRHNLDADRSGSYYSTRPAMYIK